MYCSLFCCSCFYSATVLISLITRFSLNKDIKGKCPNMSKIVCLSSHLWKGNSNITALQNNVILDFSFYKKQMYIGVSSQAH